MDNSNNQNFVFDKSQIYDLEERTFQFAKKVRLFLKKIKQTPLNREDHIQLVKASGSVGGNYIEANEALGKKDFKMRIRISRKESKESGYWLRLILETETLDKQVYAEGKELFDEAIQLKKIFSSILLKAN
jgi:four helix bundle protein